MPVEPAGFVDKQVARMLRYTSRSDDPHTHYRKTEKNRVLHWDTSTLRTASSTQLTAQQYHLQVSSFNHIIVLRVSSSWSNYVAVQSSYDVKDSKWKWHFVLYSKFQVLEKITEFVADSFINNRSVNISG